MKEVTVTIFWPQIIFELMSLIEYITGLIADAPHISLEELDDYEPEE